MVCCTQKKFTEKHINNSTFVVWKKRRKKEENITDCES